MKKILFVLSALTLLAYGCNRNEDTAVESNRGLQQEESRTMDTQNMDESNEAIPSTSPSDTVDQSDAQLEEDRGGQTPGFEKEEYRDNDTVTEPLEDRPDLEEEMEN